MAAEADQSDLGMGDDPTLQIGMDDENDDDSDEESGSDVSDSEIVPSSSSSAMHGQMML